MDRSAWRNLVSEEAIEPELPIIDAHHHVWGASPAPQFDAYDAEALIADKCDSGHNVIATVYVDSHSNYRSEGPEHLRIVGETEFAERVANEANARGGCAAGACAAIVAGGDMLVGAAAGEVLDAHMAASLRFRGIRHMTAIDPDLPPIYGATEYGIMPRPAFREGCKELEKRGLSLDTWLFHPQLPEMIDFARAMPGLTIVLDHIAGPVGIGRYADRRKEAFAEWKRDMAELATCANVYVKIGALNMVFTGLAPDPEAPRPYTSEEMAAQQRDHILTTIDLFGPTRCMFESNFPVDMMLTGITPLWNSFKIVTKDLSRSDRAALFVGTAQKAYRIAL